MKATVVKNISKKGTPYTALKIKTAKGIEKIVSFDKFVIMSLLNISPNDYDNIPVGAEIEVE